MVAAAENVRRVDPDTVWHWLADIPDPEIPVLSVVDLGVVRDVAWEGSPGEPTLCVTVTPTYSGCPATEMILASIRESLRDHGVERFTVSTRIAPPWTTDWISEDGRRKLERYGIAPPRRLASGETPPCPTCGSADTERVSQFGSTPCKALYRCRACLEPFDYFKCH